MMKRYLPGHANPCRWVFLFLVVSLGLATTGCMDSYGRIQKDASVTDMFTQSRLPEDHRYYTIGRENQPWAVIGIDPSYTLLSKIWTPVPAGSEDLTQRIQNVWSEPAGNLLHPPAGGVIYSPEGKPIGLWYSGYAFTNVKMSGENGVYVYSPYDPTPLKTAL